MPRIPFESLSDAARVWVFAAERPVEGASAELLLAEADAFLDRWHAHGEPLRCARDWREDRFLVVGVEGENASGCSIDGLFRALKALGASIGTSLVTSGLVFYRDPAGFVVAVTRPEFSELAADGMVRADTRVFDPAVTTIQDLRARFESSAGESWHGALLPAEAR
jgi:hypothetical protein